MVREQVIQWIGVEVWSLPEWYSRADIAKAAGVSKSPTLIKVLTDLVCEDVLVSARFLDSHNRPIIRYKISDDYRESQFEGAKSYGAG